MIRASASGATMVVIKSDKQQITVMSITTGLVNRIRIPITKR